MSRNLPDVLVRGSLAAGGVVRVRKACRSNSHCTQTNSKGDETSKHVLLRFHERNAGLVQAGPILSVRVVQGTRKGDTGAQAYVNYDHVADPAAGAVLFVHVHA